MDASSGPVVHGRVEPGFADPATGTGYGYVPNRMGLRIRDDPRDAALRRALADCLKSSAS